MKNPVIGAVRNRNSAISSSCQVTWPCWVGNQIIEPIAQLIVRPNETEAAHIANEDSQSLVFDANNLFNYDKFSGYDRVEGGTRANLGLRYSGTFGYGIGVNGQFGQSFQLAGDNSFAALTAYNPANYSGLEKDRSDYVAALNEGLDRPMIIADQRGYHLDDQVYWRLRSARATKQSRNIKFRIVNMLLNHL